MTALLELKHVSFHYPGTEGQRPALDDVSLTLPLGQFVAVVGPNGSGKSTFLRHLNGLLLADEGEIRLAGLNPMDEDSIVELRRNYGMMFQNPENQIVGTTVEEDLAFGLENLGTPREVMIEQIDKVLAELEMTDLKTRPVAELSGGQKQKLAIASVLVMNPQGLLMDEVTAMLDPQSRRAFLELVRAEMKKRNLTIFHVTHHMDEVLSADVALLFNQGRLTFQGEPLAMFESKAFQETGLAKPMELQVLDRLKPYSKRQVSAEQNLWEQYMTLAEGIKETAQDNKTKPMKASTKDAEAAKAERHGAGAEMALTQETLDSKETSDSKETIDQQLMLQPETNKGLQEARKLIEIQHLYFRYQPDLPWVLKDISLNIYEGECLAIVGPSGAGKSTLIQHLNGLLPLQEGEIKVFGQSLRNRKAIGDLRESIQLLFQYPEHQLFAPTIRDDIAFGPQQMGLEGEALDERVLEAMGRLNIPYDMADHSPFELSGGQKRRVALAGVLAMKPQILVLDEPAAGLDAVGKRNIFKDLKRLQKEGVTIVLVSHDMDDVSRFADRVLILDKGRVLAEGPADIIFQDLELLERSRLQPPTIYRVMMELAKLIPDLDPLCFNLECIDDKIRAYLRR